MCNLCSGKTLIQRCGSDTVMTARVDGDTLVFKATYNDSVIKATTSVMRIEMNYCLDCGRKLGDENDVLVKRKTPIE